MTMNSTWQATEGRCPWQGRLRETDLVHIVTKAFELLYAASCLFVRVIACPDSTHTGRLVTCIALRAVIEVRVGSSWTVSAGSSAVSPAKDEGPAYTQIFPVMAMCGHRCGLHITATTAIFRICEHARSEKLGLTYPTCGSDRTCSKLGQQSFLVVIRDGTDDIHQSGYSAEPILLAHFGAEFVEGHGLVRIVRLDEFSRDTGSNSKQCFGL